MAEVDKLLDVIYAGNTLWQWSVAAGVIAAAFVVLLLLRRLVRAKYTRLVATPEAELMEIPFKVASSTTLVFLFVAAVFIGLQTVALPAKASKLLLTVFTISAFWQTGLWATTAVLASIDRRRRAKLAVDRAAAGSFGIIAFLARTTIWAFVVLLTLDNLGIQIKPLLAGLGIGGIAVALALQNVLGDLFASLSITLDRPFVVGDALAVDDFNGTVEYIGVKSTRLRSLNGEQIIIPNSNLLSSRVRNYSRLLERRVVLNLAVDHSTPREALEKIPGQIRALIEAHRDNVRFDRSHFSRIAPTSFEFEAVYFVTKPDYTLHMDILQDINLRLVDALEEDGVLLAQPVQRLYLEGSKGHEPQLVAPAHSRAS
jgi:small-conductance mechanosensitive channel